METKRVVRFVQIRFEQDVWVDWIAIADIVRSDLTTETRTVGIYGRHGIEIDKPGGAFDYYPNTDTMTRGAWMRKVERVWKRWEEA